MSTKKNFRLLLITGKCFEWNVGRKTAFSQVLVAPSYSEGRNKKDPGSKPAWANSALDPILRKYPTQKQGWQSSLSCRALA
jgi:hypothetical protein